MSRDCGEIRDSIPRKLLGDLPPDSVQAFAAHLSTCADCREEEQLVLRTLSKMRAAEDVPVPRHFFVYEPQSRPSPWALFRGMSFAWQAATAAAMLSVLILGAVSAAGLRIRMEPGALILSLGDKQGPAAVTGPNQAEMQAIENRIIQVAEQKSRKEILDWVRTLREEMAQGSHNLDQRQRTLIQTALNTVERRAETRLAETTQTLENRTSKSLGDLYTTVNLQRERDVAAFNDRLSQVALNGETRSNQTDVILDTLLQAAELRLRQ
jgi:hypothetical protein